MLLPETKILLVDDNPTDRLIVSSMLRKLKARVVQEAENGNIAEAKIFNAIEIGDPFQVVLLDWNMPTANGHRFLQQLNKSLIKVKPKVIVMTASSDKETVEEAIRNGASNFIVKPVELEVLQERIEKLSL